MIAAYLELVLLKILSIIKKISDFSRRTICETMLIKLREPLINRQDTGFTRTLKYKIFIYTLFLSSKYCLHLECKLRQTVCRHNVEQTKCRQTKCRTDKISKKFFFFFPFFYFFFNLKK